MACSNLQKRIHALNSPEEYERFAYELLTSCPPDIWKTYIYASRENFSSIKVLSAFLHKFNLKTATKWIQDLESRGILLDSEDLYNILQSQNPEKNEIAMYILSDTFQPEKTILYDLYINTIDSTVLEKIIKKFTNDEIKNMWKQKEIRRVLYDILSYEKFDSITNLLYENKVDFNILYGNESLLYALLRNGNFTQIIKFIHCFNIDFPNSDKNTPLSYAFDQGYPEMTAFFLENKATFHKPYALYNFYGNDALTLDTSTIQNLSSYPTIKALSIRNCNLSVLPTLPDTLEWLDCSENPITELKIPPKCKVLYASKCNIQQFPDVDAYPLLEILDVSDNNIHDISKLDHPYLSIPYNPSHIVLKKYDVPLVPLNISGNPVPYGLLNGLGSFTNYTKERIHKSYQFHDSIVHTTILPKGTLLFHNSNDAYQEDELLGILTDKGDRILFPNYNVFFHAYPYVVDPISIDRIHGGGWKYCFVMVLEQDIEVVLGVLPSENSRENMKSNSYVKDCSLIPTGIWGVTGSRDDPCFHPEFLQDHPTISGLLYLKEQDTNYHVQSKTNKYRRFFTKYRTLFSDSVSNIGVPELILHPSSNRSSEKILTSPKIYSLFLETPHQSNKFDELWQFMEAALSPDGFHGFHMTIDLATKMYVLWERVNPYVRERCVPIEEPYKLRWMNFTHSIQNKPNNRMNSTDYPSFPTNILKPVTTDPVVKRTFRMPSYVLTSTTQQGVLGSVLTPTTQQGVLGSVLTSTGVSVRRGGSRKTRKLKKHARKMRNIRKSRKYRS